MSEWKKVKLGELYEVHNGLSKGRQFFGTGFPFLTFSNVFNNWFLPEQLESLVQTTDKEREACSIKAGDVFITRTSETMDELGMSSVALKDYPNATYNGFTKRLRPKTDRVFPRYMGYYLRTPKFRGQFMAFSSMTTRASLANNDLLNMEIELPPMDIQKNIATILSRYDSLIENYQKQIKLLEEAAQRLYKEWFIDLRFPGHENTKIVDGVPEGWEIKSITNNHLFDVAKCRIALFNGNKTYYATADVEGTYFCNSGVKIEYDNKPSRAQIQPSLYSVWFARMSNSFKIVGFVEQNNNRREDSILSSGFAGFESHYERFGFLYCLISSQWFNDQKDRYATGATQVSITNEGLSRIRCLLPTTRLAEEFSLVTNKIIEETILYRENCTMLTEARDRLLPKLMSGEIEI